MVQRDSTQVLRHSRSPGHGPWQPLPHPSLHMATDSPQEQTLPLKDFVCDVSSSGRPTCFLGPVPLYSPLNTQFRSHSRGPERARCSPRPHRSLGAEPREVAEWFGKPGRLGFKS